MSAKSLSVRETSIPGLLLVDLPVHGDNRGWFKENWQREKMVALGLPDFEPVQNNISFNDKAGATRGIHAEPWDKFVSVATGSIFGAWVDLRVGPHFGTVFTAELDSSTAIFVPRGVGNSYQTLEDNTAYAYLVNDHWSATAQSDYSFLNLADETVAIEWPIPLDRAERSEKDLNHPRLEDVVPMPPKRTLVLGANGQLGRALKDKLGNADFAGRDLVDLSSPDPFALVQWANYDTVINAAAFTAVDAAETVEGRREAWASNVTGVTMLARAAREHRLTVVHVSSDYVFDGSEESYSEDASFSPLGVYGQTKAAGDAIVASLQRHYIVRTSWVIGEGNNFVRTMQSLAQRGVRPSVVNDQIGRLSFTEDIADGIIHLLESRAAYGTYNLTNSGAPVSWAQIAERVFELSNSSAESVTGVTTEEYFAGKEVSPRPLNSILDLTKIQAAGFYPRSWEDALELYLA